MSAERKSRAQSAYENLTRSTSALTLLSECELKRLAAKLNPNTDLLRVTIFDHHRWLEDGLCQMMVLTSDFLVVLPRMRTRLIFFRQEMAAWASGKIEHDTRLVLEVQFKTSIVRLDCETGLPWLPHGRCKDHRKYCAPERRAELEKIEREAEAVVRAELAVIEKEKCSELVWHNNEYQNTSDVRRVDTLEYLTRKNSRVAFGEPKILAHRYFPQAVTYPEHVPNASLMHEVAA